MSIEIWNGSVYPGNKSDTFVGRVIYYVRIFLIAALVLAMFVTAGNALAEGQEVDVSVPHTYTIECVAPTTRTDGKTLAPTELVGYNFYSSRDKSVWADAGARPVCALPVELETFAEGQWYFQAQVVDKEGRVSGFSEVLPFIVKRVADPSPPQQLRLVSLPR